MDMQCTRCLTNLFDLIPKYCSTQAIYSRKSFFRRCQIIFRTAGNSNLGSWECCGWFCNECCPTKDARPRHSSDFAKNPIHINTNRSRCSCDWSSPSRALGLFNLIWVRISFLTCEFTHLLHLHADLSMYRTSLASTCCRISPYARWFRTPWKRLAVIACARVGIGIATHCTINNRAVSPGCADQLTTKLVRSVAILAQAILAQALWVYLGFVCTCFVRPFTLKIPLYVRTKCVS